MCQEKEYHYRPHRSIIGEYHKYLEVYSVTYRTWTNFLKATNHQNSTKKKNSWFCNLIVCTQPACKLCPLVGSSNFSSVLLSLAEMHVVCLTQVWRFGQSFFLHRMCVERVFSHLYSKYPVYFLASVVYLQCFRPERPKFSIATRMVLHSIDCGLPSD